MQATPLSHTQKAISEDGAITCMWKRESASPCIVLSRAERDVQGCCGVVRCYRAAELPWLRRRLNLEELSPTPTVAAPC